MAALRSLLLLLHCVALPLFGQEVYEYRPGSPDGTGKWYMGREIAQTMHAAHAAWLDRPEREREERPARMLERMALQPGEVVADIGCGTGYHSLRMARQVPGGRVYGVDIQAAMLDSLFARSLAQGLDNVEPVLGTEQNASLPIGQVDKVLLVDVYHEFLYPKEMMASIVAAMRPGAQLYLVEFRGEDAQVPIKDEHRMTKAQCILELEAAGLQWERGWNGLPWQHFLVFRKPA